MSTVVEPIVANEPGSKPRWIGLRIAVLLGVLIIVNAMAGKGFLAVHNTYYPFSPLSDFTSRFCQGWESFAPVMAALCLAGLGGSAMGRFPLVLGALVFVAGFPFVLLYASYRDSNFFQEFLAVLLHYLVVVFALNAVLLPLRGYLGWLFWFAPPEPGKLKSGMRWSLFDIVALTANAAFAMTFFRLYDLWNVNFFGQGVDPYSALTLFVGQVPPLMSGAAAGYLLFFSRPAWRYRLGAIAAALIVVWLFWYWQASQTPGIAVPLDSISFITMGVIAAPLVNFAILRLFGIRLHSTASPSTHTV